MIYAAILDTSRAQEISLRPSLSASVLSRVTKAKNSRIKRQRCAAYSLLAALYEAVYRDTIPEIVFSDEGKPSLLKCDIGISISHRDGVAIAVLNDSGEVGCDVEDLESSHLTDKLREKYLSSLDCGGIDSPECELTLIPFCLDECGEVRPIPALPTSLLVCDEAFSKPIISHKAPSGEDILTLAPFEIQSAMTPNIRVKESRGSQDSVCLWTVAESLLKLDGGGLSDYKSLQSIRNVAKTVTYKLDLDVGSYYLSVSFL